MAHTRASSEISEVIKLLTEKADLGNLYWVGSAYTYRQKMGSLPETVLCYIARHGKVYLEIFFQFTGHREPARAVLDIDGALYSGTEVDELTDAIQENMRQSLRRAVDYSAKKYHEELKINIEAYR